MRGPGDPRTPPPGIPPREPPSSAAPRGVPATRVCAQRNSFPGKLGVFANPRVSVSPGGKSGGTPGWVWGGSGGHAPPPYGSSSPLNPVSPRDAAAGVGICSHPPVLTRFPPVFESTGFRCCHQHPCPHVPVSPRVMLLSQPLRPLGAAPGIGAGNRFEVESGFLGSIPAGRCVHPLRCSPGKRDFALHGAPAEPGYGWGRSLGCSVEPVWSWLLSAPCQDPNTGRGNRWRTPHPAPITGGGHPVLPRVVLLSGSFCTAGFPAALRRHFRAPHPGAMPAPLDSAAPWKGDTHPGVPSRGRSSQARWVPGWHLMAEVHIWR